jgi:hypothetical protein
VPLGVPKIIMEFYQADILEEEVIKQWGTHVSKKVSSPSGLSLFYTLSKANIFSFFLSLSLSLSLSVCG